MKLGTILGIIVVIALFAFGVFFFDVDQTESASLPDVDVSVEGGNMPEFDVEAGDVDVGTETVTVEVPTIDVESPEEEAASATN